MTSDEKHQVVVDSALEMQARDGTVLRADVYRPDADGRFPVLLLRTPYGKSRRGEWAQNTEVSFFPQRGFVVVIQDVRGRGGSGGDYYPFLNEGPDSYDAVEWAAALPWSNGRVATIGQSYMASIQYGVAPLRPPHLVAMCPTAGAASLFRNGIYRDGVFELRWRLAYFTAMERLSYQRAGRYRQERARLDSYVIDPDGAFSLLTPDAYRHLPLKEWGERLCGQRPYLAEMIANSKDGPYWHGSDATSHISEVAVPVFHVGSWYDAFLRDTLDMYSLLREGAANTRARRGQRLMIGPWAHLEPYSVPTTGGTGDIDFGSAAAIELHQIQLRFLDAWMRGTPNGLHDESPVRLFVMGINRWRDEDAWPLARARERRLHLHADTAANSRRGGGRLRWEPPGGEEPDRFTYDPDDPVPTTGGPIIGEGCGVYDQRKVENRNDVLVYVSEPLPAQMEVTGPVTVELWAATSARDTDFTAKLIDIRPDGYAQNLTEGIVRARFRNSLSEPTPVRREQVYKYRIDLGATSHVFAAGHRIGIDVTSSNFPRFDRNSGTGRPFGEDRHLERAHQTIFHDHQRPSAVLLPIIP